MIGKNWTRCWWAASGTKVTSLGGRSLVYSITVSLWPAEWHDGCAAVCIMDQLRVVAWHRFCLSHLSEARSSVKSGHINVVHKKMLGCGRLQSLVWESGLA